MNGRSPAAQAAFRRGETSERTGDLAAAERAFELAQRLAPSDREITMAIGRVRLARGEPRASEAFELVAHAEDWRDAWLCLAGVRRRFGHTDLAVRELQQALSRHAPPRVDAFTAFCDDLLQRSGQPGWCGLSADGTLSLTLRDGRSPRGLLVSLDGIPVALPQDGSWQKLRLPEGWQRATRIAALHDNAPLIGSPISVAAILRCEGFVAARNGGLEGWVWHPADPDHDPVLSLRTPAGETRLQITADRPAAIPHPMPGARLRAFTVPDTALGLLAGPVMVVGPDGRALAGSPVDPGMERRSAAAACAEIRRLFPPDGPGPGAAGTAAPAGEHATGRPIEMPAIPADLRGAPRRVAPQPGRKVDVVIPAYRGLEETLASIESARAGLPRGCRVVVVEDASPEPALSAALDRLAAQRRIVLHRLPANRGFPGAANAGLRLAAGRDVVLLNSDTLCPPGWLARLRAAAHAAPDIGTVTPLSNDATIMSYPTPGDGNPIPSPEVVARLDAWAQAACGTATVDLPTAIGFCMYIRRECLDEVGLLREDVFGQGYGEENDFCLRARHLGWRHVGLPGLFVGHVGGRSFGTAKAHLITRNLEVMERLHPGYAALIAGWCASDPMAVHRRAIDAARFTAAAHAEAVVLLTHGREGGVLRRVEERAAALRAEGLRPVVLRPAEEEGRRFCMVSEGVGAAHPNLRFAMPEELPALLDLLRAARVRLVELHHFIGHDPVLLDLPAQLGVPSEAVLHDYAWFCPRINLVSGGHYCGEPDLATCETCVRDHGATIEEEIRPTVLVARSTRILGAARRVITPSADTARRYRRHLPRLRPEKLAWEDDAALPPLIVRPPGPMLKVAVVGAIGIEKGFDLLLGCAREAAGRRRPLRFAVIGHTCDDDRLLEVGNVTITGPYAEHEAAALIEAEAADLAFLPSIWPETWCYTLTTAWQGGLAVLAFDIGAPAERIRATGRGWVLPLGASPAMVNDGLFAAWRQMQASASAAERGAAERGAAERGTEAGGTAPQGAVA